MRYAENLAELERSIAGCLHCNGCHYASWPENHDICPIYARDHTFTHSAGGLMFLAKAVLRQQLDYSQELAELVYTCSACRACDDQCSLMRSSNPIMPLSDIIRLLKYELVKRDLIPAGIRESRQAVKADGDLTVGADAAEPLIPDSIRDEMADTVLYAECFHGPGQRALFTSAVSLLEKMRQPVAVHATGGAAARRCSTTGSGTRCRR